MTREDPQLKIRLPAELKESIEASAKFNGRSINADVIARLQLTFNRSYLDLSDEGIIAIFKRLEATTMALEDLYLQQRDDLRAGVTSEDTRPQFLKHISQGVDRLAAKKRSRPAPASEPPSARKPRAPRK